MPQATGKLTWITNNRVHMPEKRVRTGNLSLRLENMSLDNDLRHQTSTMMDKKYRQLAERDYEMNKVRLDAEKLFHQAKMTKEVSGKWTDLIRSKSSYETVMEQKLESSEDTETAGARVKSAFPRVRFPSKSGSNRPGSRRPVKSATTVATGRSRSSSVAGVENYSRSYKYLRDLIHFDNLSRENFQRSHDQRLSAAKKQCIEQRTQLNKKVGDFLTEVDRFKKISEQHTLYVDNTNTDDKFLQTLQMPNFHILVD